MLLRVQLPPLPPPPLPPKSLPNPNPKPRNLPLRTFLSSSSSSSSAAAASHADAGVLFREKLLYLSDELGVDPSRALALNPALRAAPVSSIRDAAAVLFSFGLLPADAARVFSAHPDLLTADPSASLLPAFHFLLGPVAIPFSDLRLAVSRCPRLLAASVPLLLLPALHFLRRLGFVGRHRITAHTSYLLVSSVEKTLIPKLDFLQSLGFTEQETRKMVLRSPGLLSFSIEGNFRPKVQFLVEEMGRNVAELKEFPQYFSFSLEGKIKPRHRMLQESRFTMPLKEMLRVSDGEFMVRLLEMRLRAIDKRS